MSIRSPLNLGQGPVPVLGHPGLIPVARLKTRGQPHATGLGARTTTHRGLMAISRPLGVDCVAVTALTPANGITIAARQGSGPHFWGPERKQ